MVTFIINQVVREVDHLTKDYVFFLCSIAIFYQSVVHFQILSNAAFKVNYRPKGNKLQR